jgi:hypothetical protein
VVSLLQKKEEAEKSKPQYITWGDLAFSEKLALAKYLHSKLPADSTHLIDLAKEKMQIVLVPDEITEIMANYHEALGIYKDKQVWYKWMGDKDKDVLQTDIMDLAKKGKNYSDILKYVKDSYKLAQSYDWTHLVEEMITATDKKIEKPKMYYSDFALVYLAQHLDQKMTASEIYDAFLAEHSEPEGASGLVIMGNTLENLAFSKKISGVKQPGSANLYWMPKVTIPKPPMATEAAPVLAEMTTVEVSPKYIDKQIVELTKQGWSKEALLEYFKGKMDEPTLKQKVKEAFKLYQPEYKPEASTYEQQGAAFQSWLKAYTWEQLNKGKGIHDIGWQIAHYFNIAKDSVMPMIREQSVQPLTQVAALIEMIKAKPPKMIGGCQVKAKEDGSPDIDELKPTAVAFCQGLYNNAPQNYTADLIGGGKQALAVQSNQVIAGKEEGGGGQFQFEIKKGNIPTDDPKWQPVDAEVMLLLNEMGFNCAIDDKQVMSCQLTGANGSSLSIASQDTIRKAALFLSRLEGIQELDAKCRPAAVQYARNQAKQANQTSKPWSVMPYPKSKADWEQIVCSKL